MKDIIHQLHAGAYSCVIWNEEVRTFTRSGISDLYDLFVVNPDFLQGASIAEKVVGKAAASLIILGKVKEVYTDVISLSALILLRKTNISVAFGQVVPYIMNADRTDWCPMERICYEEKFPLDIFHKIDEYLRWQKIYNVYGMVYRN